MYTIAAKSFVAHHDLSRPRVEPLDNTLTYSSTPQVSLNVLKLPYPCVFTLVQFFPLPFLFSISFLIGSFNGFFPLNLRYVEKKMTK